MNYANPDLLGHTAIEKAAVKGMETIDACIAKALPVILDKGGVLVICGDHGNAEQLKERDSDAPYMANTTNPVPVYVVNSDPGYTLRPGGCLADIVPTLIDAMHMEKPSQMTGKSLLIPRS